MIDFHCHIDLYPDPASVAASCESQDLYVLSVTTTPSAWHGTKALERGHIRTALGLHPQLARERKSELSLFEELLPSARYVGEVGLDGSPECKSFWNDQLDVFNRVLSLTVNNGGRIMSIHSRRAASAVLDCLEAHGGSNIPVLHWFSGSQRDLERASSMGCWFSVGPAMLRGERGRKLAARMPRDRLLTETDGPFAEIEGQSLMPWDAERASVGLAEVWKMDLEQVEAELRSNLKNLTSAL